MNTKFLNTRYILMQVCYWGIVCALTGYAAVYLAGKGFTAGQTGSLTALGSVGAFILQPIAAAQADKAGKFSLKELLLSIGVVNVLFILLLCVMGNNFWIVAILFCAAGVTTQILQPLINSVSMYYMNRGEKINFGLARGIGSVAYAGISYLLGSMVEVLGEEIVPISALVLCVIFLLISVSFQMKKRDRQAQDQQEEASALGMRALLNQHRDFAAVLMGIVFVFVFHFMSNTYMFQMIQAVGGNSRSMGTAVSLAAIAEIPVMLFFSYLVKKVRVEMLLRIAGIVWTLKGLAYCLCGSVLGIYGIQILQMFSFAIYIPASVYYANQVMDENNKVRGQAMVTMAYTVGGVFGNLLGGRLIDAYNVHVMLIVGTVCAAVGTGFFFLGTRKKAHGRTTGLKI